MNYWHYLHHAAPAAYPSAFVSTPPLSTYYSPRVEPYVESRRRADEHRYTTEASPRYYYEDEVEEVLEDEEEEDYYYEVEEPVRRKPSRRQQQQQQQSATTRATKARPVTAQDCIDAGIPAGYSTKNWDPDEEPIFLLGSVFDANSLGKWIYDWTVYRHGPDTSALAVAGDLWLALIALAHKMRRAEQLLLQRRKAGSSSSGVSGAAKCKRLADFLDDGDELWYRLDRLLRACEKSMMRVARRDRNTGHVVGMDAAAGCEFVDCLLDEDRQLDATEDLIDSMMSWDKRFDAAFSKKGRKRRTM